MRYDRKDIDAANAAQEAPNEQQAPQT
jgi:hypothetical protein